MLSLVSSNPLLSVVSAKFLHLQVSYFPFEIQKYFVGEFVRLCEYKYVVPHQILRT